ncbi:hypothetical protein GCM10020000_12890 [Streptomyces olivoverticillatus]
MAEGRSNAGIAAELVVGAAAVEKYIRSIFTKFGLQPEAGGPPPGARRSTLSGSLTSVPHRKKAPRSRIHRTRRPRRGHRPRRLGHRRDAPPDHPYSGSWQAEAGKSKLLDVRTEGMGVTLKADDTSRVEVKATGGYDDNAPEISVAPSGEKVAVVGKCAGDCSVQLHITLPSRPGREGGDRRAERSRRPISPAQLDLHTTSGSIDVDHASGPLTLHSGNGAVTLSDSRSPDASVTTGNGAVDATFASAPAKVNITTHDGAVDLRVPHDAELLHRRTELRLHPRRQAPDRPERDPRDHGEDPQRRPQGPLRGHRDDRCSAVTAKAMVREFHFLHHRLRILGTALRIGPI